MKKYAGVNESLVNEDESEITPKRASLSNPSGYKIPMPEEPSYENTDRMSDLSNKVTTGEGMQKMEAAPSTPKPKIVTKEELAKSGLTLREYMNQQQGRKSRSETSSESGPSTYGEMLKNAPAGTSEAAMKALRNNAKNEANKLADLEKGNSRGQKSSVAAPKITKSESSKKPYNPGSVNNSYTGSKFSKGGMTASRRGDGIAQRGKTRGKMC